MAMENGLEKINNLILGNGKKANQTDMEFKFGQIKTNIKGNFVMD